jgi:ketosteroid isomerase-like protein
MVDIEAEKQLIEQLIQENVEADKSKDLDRIMNLFTENIVYHVSGFPQIVGKDDLRGFIAASFDQLDDLEMVSERTEVSSSGDLAYNTGWFRMRNAGMEDFVVFKYAFVLKKVDGVWKIVVDAYSPNTMEARAF